jgi:hypothetical protein
MDAHVRIEPDSALTQPWNKGKLTLLARNMSGRLEHGFNC